ncbi:hypothetical protein Nepgr_018248 [Nepenthes gracilis]|uniref:Uncharacterized protein n=1 Tax=Nepenthes gracilis TaxID=150966 RepID=A0AAD3XSX1_NEPGR|nr:hypothetical protein Nepgr_018248 [Nepenthes gracilis]
MGPIRGIFSTYMVESRVFACLDDLISLANVWVIQDLDRTWHRCQRNHCRLSQGSVYREGASNCDLLLQWPSGDEIDKMVKEADLHGKDSGGDRKQIDRKQIDEAVADLRRAMQEVNIDEIKSRLGSICRLLFGTGTVAVAVAVVEASTARPLVTRSSI